MKSRLKIEKWTMFFLVLILFTGFIGSFFKLVYNQKGDLETIFEKSFYQSLDYGRESSDLFNKLNALIYQYKTEDYILNKKEFKDEEYGRLLDELYSEYETKSYDVNKSYSENYDIFKKKYKEEIEEVKERLKKEQIYNMASVEKNLPAYSDIVYYATDGKVVFTNSESKKIRPEFFDKFKSNLIFDGYNFSSKPNDYNAYFNFKLGNDYYGILRDGYSGNEDKSNYKIYIGFQDDYIEKKENIWQTNKDMAIKDIKETTYLGLGLAISFIILVFLTGRSDDENIKVKMTSIDRIYTDINFILCIGIISLWFGSLIYLDNTGLSNILTEGSQKRYTSILEVDKIVLLITFFLGWLGLTLVLSLIRHLKNRTLLKHSLFYTILSRIWNFLKEIHNSSSNGKKVVIGLIAYPIILLVTIFIFPITIGVVIWLALKKVRDYEKIKLGLKEIKAGNLDYKIEIEKDGELKSLAEDINDIGLGLKGAVDNELKSERYKAELITNVSHDIRTPLTSIITYIDLLKQEKDEEKVEEYIEVLEQKSERLKRLIDDLFEASKVSSGNIPVNFTKLDIVSLIRQGLGEMNDKIELNNLKFIINEEEEELYVRADGDLLWRAIENLLSNIFKYGRENSRVYIDIEKYGEDSIRIIMKNISAYELNITAEELVQRFKRGDESRTSEGSGLGLSITESLIELQDGNFSVEIDGDLFKTIITLKEYK